MIANCKSIESSNKTKKSNTQTVQNENKKISQISSKAMQLLKKTLTTGKIIHRLAAVT